MDNSSNKTDVLCQYRLLLTWPHAITVAIYIFTKDIGSQGSEGAQDSIFVKWTLGNMKRSNFDIL